MSIEYPNEMTPALAELLGMPPFELHPIWLALRECGVKIEPRYEAEVAAALHFLIPLALQHGDDWQFRAAEVLIAMRASHRGTPTEASAG